MCNKRCYTPRCILLTYATRRPTVSGQAFDYFSLVRFLSDAIVALEVSDAVLFQRMGGRLVNPSTGEVYGLANPPPKELEHCLVRRSDDSAEVLETRIKIYRDSWQDISRRLLPGHVASTLGGGTSKKEDGTIEENEGLQESTHEAVENQDILAVIDGAKSVEEVYSDVVSFLKRKFGKDKIVERET